MKIKLVILLLLICFVTVALSHEKISIHEKYEEFKEVTKKELEQTFGGYLKSTSFEYDPRINKVDIHVEVDDDFSKLSKLEQFTYFDMTYQQIRLYLKYKKLSNPFWKYNLQFHVDGKQTLKYDNAKCHKNLIDYSCGVLTINDEEKVNKTELRQDKQLLHEYRNARTSNGVLEKQVVDYYENFFNMVTRGRTYYRINQDKTLAIKNVMGKFQLSREEFDRIYYKYYVLLK